MVKKLIPKTRFHWFTIGIIVPSVILMVFGLRAMRNERYTLEHRIQDRYYRAASTLSAEMENSIATLIVHTDSLIQSRAFRTLTHPLVSRVYFLPVKGRVQHHSRYIKKSELPIESYMLNDNVLDSFLTAVKGYSANRALDEAGKFLSNNTSSQEQSSNSRPVAVYMSIYSAAKDADDRNGMSRALKDLFAVVTSDTAAVLYEEAKYYSSFIIAELVKIGEDSANVDEMKMRSAWRRYEASEIYRLEEVSMRGRLPDAGFHYIDTSLYLIRSMESYGSLILKLSPEALHEAAIAALGDEAEADICIFGPHGVLYSGTAALSGDQSIKKGVGIRTRFASQLPMLTLQIHESKPDEIRTLLNRYRIIYGIFFFLLIAAIAIGSFSLAVAAKRETEIARMRANFIAGVSHELKTPLTSIHMLSDMLKSGKIKDEAKKLEYYSIINKESDRLSGLINRILDFSKINEGRITFDALPVNLDSVVDEALMSLSALLDEKDAEVDRYRAKESLVISGDKKMLVQVVINLLENSVKYSTGKPHIVISCHVEGQFASLSVRDHGIGIKTGEEKLIFGEFFRGASEQVKSVSGTGLGLSIVSKIVEQHNGSISARNADGGGLSVEVLFPTA